MGDELARLLEQYGDTTYLLERLIIGLKKKQRSEEWDTSFGTAETRVPYAASDDDLSIELPEAINEQED